MCFQNVNLNKLTYWYACCVIDYYIPYDKYQIYTDFYFIFVLNNTENKHCDKVCIISMT